MWLWNGILSGESSINYLCMNTRYWGKLFETERDKLIFKVFWLVIIVKLRILCLYFHLFILDLFKWSFTTLAPYNHNFYFISFVKLHISILFTVHRQVCEKTVYERNKVHIFLCARIMGYSNLWLLYVQGFF